MRRSIHWSSLEHGGHTACGRVNDDLLVMTFPEALTTVYRWKGKACRPCLTKAKATIRKRAREIQEVR